MGISSTPSIFARVRGLIDPDKVVLGGTARESSLKIEPTILDGVTPMTP